MLFTARSLCILVVMELFSIGLMFDLRLVILVFGCWISLGITLLDRNMVIISDIYHIHLLMCFVYLPVSIGIMEVQIQQCCPSTLI